MFNFNPYLNYQQRLMQMEQQQNLQPVQQMQPMQPQMQALFVSKADDLKNFSIMPNVLYIGINQASKEIYVRQMNNDGITELNTYSLASENKEKGTLEKILERIDNLELSLKGKGNEWNDKPNVGANASRKISKSPHDGNVSTNDAE